MKVSLGIQRKNSSNHFSLPTYGENPVSPNQIHIDQPSQTLNDHHGWSAMSGALPELPHQFSVNIKEKHLSPGAV